MFNVTERPSSPRGTPLYYAVICGLFELAKHLIVTHREDVNAKCGIHGSPLHAASSEGHLDVARLLLDHTANVNLTIGRGRTPLQNAYEGEHLQVMQLLLERGAYVDMWDGNNLGTLLHRASHRGQADSAHLLLRHNANVNDVSNRWKMTPLHVASRRGHTKVAQVLLEYGANVHAKDSRTLHSTTLRRVNITISCNYCLSMAQRRERIYDKYTITLLIVLCFPILFIL